MNINVGNMQDDQMLKHTACMGVLQVDLYKHVLRSKSVAALMSGRASEPSEGVLTIITSLKKLCNHPDLLYSSSSGEKQASLSASVSCCCATAHTCSAPVSQVLHCELVCLDCQCHCQWCMPAIHACLHSNGSSLLEVMSLLYVKCGFLQ